MSSIALAAEETAFAPAELEKITGISPEVQRVWRARGHIPQSAGAHARYSPLIVASLMVRKALTNLGVAHREIANLSYKAAPHVLRWAWAEPGAWRLSNLAGNDLVEEQAVRQSEVLQQVSGMAEGDIRRFIARVGDGRIELQNDVLKEFREAPSGFFLDLKALGHTLVEKAGRPILHVRIARVEPL